MRTLSRSIAALAFVSFLTITMSGFHLHADVDGHDETLSHDHDLHHVVDHDLDHESEHIDVSVFEPARGFTKVETLAAGITLPELTAPNLVRMHTLQHTPSAPPRDYSRWRPPLRAPPFSA